MHGPILAIETSTDVCSVALIRETGAAEKNLVGGRLHDAKLVTMIDEVCAGEGVGRADLAGVAVSSGPGSYTGLRIGVSVAKAIAIALHIPLVPVRSLVAAAFASQSLGVLLSAFPSRRHEAFAAVIRVGEQTAVQEGPTYAGTPAQILQALAESGTNPVMVVGPGALRFSDDPTPHKATPASAEAIGRLGVQGLTEGRSVDPELFEPYYFKDFVAGTPTQSVFARLPF